MAGAAVQTDQGNAAIIHLSPTHPMEWRKPDDSWEQHRRMLEGLQQVAGSGSMIISRFAADVRQLIENGVETRRLLAEQVYRIPDAWLDEVVRVRIADLEADEDDEEGGPRPDTGDSEDAEPG